MKNKLTKKELEVAKNYWKLLKHHENIFIEFIDCLEESMRLATGKDLEFFMVDGEYVGIGDVDRKIRLYQSEELEV